MGPKQCVVCFSSHRCGCTLCFISGCDPAKVLPAHGPMESPRKDAITFSNHVGVSPHKLLTTVNQLVSEHSAAARAGLGGPNGPLAKGRSKSNDKTAATLRGPMGS